MKPQERKESAIADRWMLDNFWGHPARHVVTVETRVDLGGDREYRSVCSCGWRSITLSFQEAPAHCEVYEALRIRTRRLELDSKDPRHDNWASVVAVVVDAGPSSGLHVASSQADGHHEEQQGSETGKRDAVLGCAGPDAKVITVEVDPRD